MKIAELIHDLPCALTSGSADVEVTGITEDSRTVRRGDLFVARPGGAHDGRTFIDAAVGAGACAVLTDAPVSVKGTAVLRSRDVAAVAGRLAERIYGVPSRRLKLLGITGTNGKTTTAHLVQSLLGHAGLRCGLMGTIHIDDGQQRRPARLTTPSSTEISGLLSEMVEGGCGACVMEVSSHALDQGRVAALEFAGAVFTNISGDHLDYHETMEAYVAAKARLFANLPAQGFAVLNVDDPASARMAQDCQARIVECSLQSDAVECRAHVRSTSIGCVACDLRGPWGDLDLMLPLTGAHNVANALQAAAVAHEMGLSSEDIAAGLTASGAPRGRLEPVETGTLGFDVLVDYAHTDDALANVLSALRQVMAARHGTPGQLRVVFGCGGDRDRTKRSRMAQVACRLADDVVITSDNPRTEAPQAVIDEILTGVPEDRRSDTTCTVDRAEAIRTAVERCQPGDVVLIAGKGHEDYQIIGTERRSFDDVAVAAAAVEQRGLVVTR
jgi:UDP-N-acetylmuramoyl-L-alanyl-D-glutamate--2,6-diaminopimelate ligase